ncbi:MAG: DUF2066 domain-containing protein [Dokdonella sp.]
MGMPSLQSRPGWWLCAALALLLPLVGIAAPATYSGEAPVASQSEAERTEALKSALADVVMRISGDAGVLSRSDVARAVADAGRYVLQYQYRRDVGTDPVSGALQVHTTLVAQFDRNAVDQMLAALGLRGAQSSVAFDPTPSEAKVWISGIGSAEDYARVLGYLDHHPMLREVRAMQARADGLLVRLTVIGGLPRFVEEVDGEGILRVANAAPALEGIDATLVVVP